MFGASFVSFDEHQQLTEYLAQVASVDLVYDETYERSGSSFARWQNVEEDPVLQSEGSGFVWQRAISSDEVFIGIRLMKLNHFDPLIVHFLTPRRKGLRAQHTIMAS